MENERAILDNVIEEMEKRKDTIDLEDLDVMYNLRERLEREGKFMETENFRFAVRPMVEKYELPVDLSPLHQ